MKNKKGFTLVELLSTMAILAIILGIASASYIGIKRHIRRSYYNTLEESLLVSGGEYFSYTTDKPNIFGDEKKISLKKLVDGKYITEVIDQKGKSCNLSDSYVMAYKNSSDKNDYYVCLKCPDDDYPNDKDNINKACSGEVTYGLRMIATIGNTSKLYKEGEYTNQDVKLTFQTFNDVTKIEVKKDNKVVKTCTMTDKNGLKSCSVEITSSGKYEYYGKTGENQTKSGTIDILIDKVKPEFNVYDNESLIDKNEVLKSTESNNKSIIVNVKDIKDLDSGVKTIKYTFDSNYINIDRTKEEFKIEKELNLGKTNLKIEVEDYAGNINTRVITYEVYKETTKPDTAYCNTLTYNGKNQTLTKESDSFTFSNNVKKNAGTYKVVAKLNENYRWQDKTNEDVKINCSIGKKDVTIQANDQMLTGDSNLNQSIDQVTITGLVTGDKLESIKLTASGELETGSIIPSDAVIKNGSNNVNDNYNITYKNGTYKRDTKICANIYINGASKIGTSTGDKELCCNSTNGSSCAITLPSITPKSGFTALGYSDDGDALTSASYQANQTVTIYKPTSDDGELASYYAITRSTTRNTYKVTFDLNGATSYTIGGSTYTASKTFSCNADYAYNGDELPDECGITLPTITRSGFIIHGWAEDSSKQSATYKVNQVITLHDDIDLFAITSKSVTLKYNTNSTTTVTTDNLTSKKETKTMFNTDGVMFNIPSYNDGKVCRNNGNDKYHGYQLLGLSSNQSGNNVEFCFGDQIYLESDKTLFLVWQDKYATAVGNVSGNLKLRAGPGTDYDQLDSIAKGDPVYIQSANYTWRKSHTWYPVIYGSKIGWAAGNTSNNSTLKNLKLTSTPNADSCKYAYSCTSNNKLLSITPSDVVLNITSNTSKQKMQQTLSIANQCGPMTGAISSNSSLVTATTSGVVKAVSGSVAVNQTKSAVVTFSTKYGCREQVNVLVKNTEATAPDITISVSGDSSTCSGSYIKGATATVTCRSDLPITSYSAKIGSTSYTETTSGNTKTSTISLSSTGSKTINVTCSNAEGTSTASKSVSIKVKNASSSCGCSTYYTASTAGTSCSRCKSWSKTGSGTYGTANYKDISTYCSYSSLLGAFKKSAFTNWRTGTSTKYNADVTYYKCTSFACKTYKTCCHT
mgnify:CR=1 FL=1